jgi:WD40 repeat protein
MSGPKPHRPRQSPSSLDRKRSRSRLDGQRIVTASADKTAIVWEAFSGKQLVTLKGHTDGISSVAFSPSECFGPESLKRRGYMSRCSKLIPKKAGE